MKPPKPLSEIVKTQYQELVTNKVIDTTKSNWDLEIVTSVENYMLDNFVNNSNIVNEYKFCRKVWLKQNTNVFINIEKYLLEEYIKYLQDTENNKYNEVFVKYTEWVAKNNIN